MNSLLLNFLSSSISPSSSTWQKKIQTTKLSRAFVINEVSTEPFPQSFGSLLLKADPENQSLDFEEQFKDKHLCQQFDSLLNVTDPDEVVLVKKKC